MRKWLAVLFFCAGCMPTGGPKPQAQTERWVAYYDKALPASTFKKYDLVVFDRRYHPNFTSLKKGKTKVLAYVSVGEVQGDRTDKKETLAKDNALRGHNAEWDSHVVDVSNREWQEAVMAEVEDAMEKGFDGVMLDTVDSTLYHAALKSDEEAEKSKESVVSLIRVMRARYPQAKLMINRGFDILPEVAVYLDYILAESILSQTDVSTGQSKFFPADTYHLAVSRLEKAQQNAPWLKIYTLDYWNQDDVQGMANIYAIHRARGYSPYVSTPDLRQHTPEPARSRRAAILNEDSHA